MNQRGLAPGEGVAVEDLPVRIVGYAARSAPAILIERLAEEWLADLREQSGLIARLRFAIGCVWAAGCIRHDHVTATTSAGNTSVRPDARSVMAARAYHGPPLYSRHSESSAQAASAMCDINVTPLIDVMLVLLATLIITLPAMTHAVKLNMLPEQATAQTQLPEVINLDIDFDGAVVWNGAAMHDPAQLDNYLQSAARKDPQPELHLRPDPHVKYDFVARVLAAAQRNQMANIGFADTPAFEE
jgi:biopolymer transport protein ExbD